ncbi:glutamate-rich protein 6 [Cheilinus undulatus]|uniref:glutamate-rich protein 6 n=1 Tax=Cheilinus undulatus TaxID=241271 RepID=UPI001BD501DA|nr:glutamate-rich protein 6 [Cheilinus undulatus]
MEAVSDLPTFGIRAAGVLRYGRESDNPGINLTPILPEPNPLTEAWVKCEYCGGNAKPSLLDLTWAQGPETAPTFCCERWQQLWEMLERHSSDLRAGGMQTTTSITRATTDFQGRLGKPPATKTLKNYVVYEPEPEPLPPSSRVLRFQLYSASNKGCRTAPLSGSTKKPLKVEHEEDEVLLPRCTHTTSQFGLCHHQDGAEILQRYYGNGLKCLTVFSDGSAQVLYPSGLLALVIVVTEHNGRVCIVYDDAAASHQPMRAMFLSDGRATCYHSNGKAWLTLNRSGGQFLDKEGARVRWWSWDNPSLSAAPLKPVFLSLNKAVGVRVLGKEQVFVSFLAGGQQAKFSVGSCCAQAACGTIKASPGASVLKEELFVLAARIKLHLPIHHDLIRPSNHLLQTTKASRHHAVAQRLLEVSADVIMSESERDFIHRCLQGYL